MPDIRGITHDGGRRENVCIDSYRILDSCKDKDCFEDTKLLLSDYGQEIIDKSGSVRVIGTEILWTDIAVTPVRFNRGFYQINIRFYTKVLLEACVSSGKPQEVEGLAVNDKTVVLFGGEGHVNIFRSGDGPSDFCMRKNDETKTSNRPTAVVEVVDPIALSAKLGDHGRSSCCTCCCSAEDLPGPVLSRMNCSMMGGHGDRCVYVTLGYFSIIRMERPTQLVVTATEYAVPDKVCPKNTEEDPCAVFSRMNFPVGEFSTSTCPCDEH